MTGPSAWRGRAHPLYPFAVVAIGFCWAGFNLWCAAVDAINPMRRIRF